MNDLAPTTLRDTAARFALEAGAILLEGYGRVHAPERKGRIDLVTEYDKRSEALLLDRIAARYPGHAVLAEESGEHATASDVRWVIDPLDGTTNFAHGHPFFAVSIGLALGASLLAGVVVAPALGVTWRASRGAGATRNGAPCRVSATERLGDSLLATGFPYDVRTNPLNNFDEFSALTRASRGVRRCGSAAIDLCMTADGTFDGYWERFLKPWDMAAGAAIVAEAGGALTALDGSTADVRSGALVASNGRVHAALLEAIAGAR